MRINVYDSERNRNQFDLPDTECMEIRPDFGVYHPIATFSKIERAIQSHQLAPVGPWSFSIAKARR